MKSWQYSFLEEHADAIEDLFERARIETDMGSICDLERTGGRFPVLLELGNVTEFHLA